MDKIIGKISFPLGSQERLQPTQLVMTRRGNAVELSVRFENGANKGILAFGFTVLYYDAEDHLLGKLKRSVRSAGLQKGKEYEETISLPGKTEYGFVVMNVVIFDDVENWHGERRAGFATYERVEKEATEYLSGKRAPLQKGQQHESKEAVVTSGRPKVTPAKKDEEQTPDPDKNQKIVATLSMVISMLITAFAVICEIFYWCADYEAKPYLWLTTVLFFVALAVMETPNQLVKRNVYFVFLSYVVLKIVISVITDSFWSPMFIMFSMVVLLLEMIPISLLIFGTKRNRKK